MARILRVVRGQDGTMQVVVQGLERFRVLHWISPETYLRARVVARSRDRGDGHGDRGAHGEPQGAGTGGRASFPRTFPTRRREFLATMTDPRYLALPHRRQRAARGPDAQKLLEIDSVKEKLRALIMHLGHQKEVLSLGQKIRTEAKEEMEKDQREYFLRQQMKAIQKELGEMDEASSVGTEYTEKLAKANLPEEAQEGGGARAEAPLRDVGAVARVLHDQDLPRLDGGAALERRKRRPAGRRERPHGSSTRTITTCRK